MDGAGSIVVNGLISGSKVTPDLGGDLLALSEARVAFYLPEAAFYSATWSVETEWDDASPFAGFAIQSSVQLSAGGTAGGTTGLLFHSDETPIGFASGQLQPDSYVLHVNSYGQFTDGSPGVQLPPDFTRQTVFSAALDLTPIGSAVWTHLGASLPGVAGAPQLAGTGTLAVGSSNQVDLDNAAPSATAAFFLAPSSTPVPFKGGTLVPFPFLDPVMLTTSQSGTIALPFVMPAGIPSGAEIWAQWAIQDAGAPVGVALSNALLGVTP